MLDRKRVRAQCPILHFRGVRKALDTLLRASCQTILKFLKVWRWIDTVLSLSFPTDNRSIERFKVTWWIHCVHDVCTTSSVHRICKKWSKFSLYVLLKYGGSIQPEPKWLSWFPPLPSDCWMDKAACELTNVERAYSRILIDKRGFPAGDDVTAEEALQAHTQTLTKNLVLSQEHRDTLRKYSRLSALEILKSVGKAAFKRKTGHISITNSACLESSRGQGGRRKYVLREVSRWLQNVPTESYNVALPTKENIVYSAGKPLWMTVKPSHMEEACEGFSIKRYSTGLYTEDFKSGESERIGFQMFAWAYTTLIKDGYLNEDGSRSSKPIPMKRVPIGEPGCKVRIATKTIAALVTYGQPFAHSWREILEHDPTLRAGLSSGSQLGAWMRQLEAKNKGRIPKYVMVGDFESATDHISHEAGKIAMSELLSAFGAHGGYSKSYLDLLLSPRVYTDSNGVEVITNTGSLMGEPGTKIILTFLAKVANCYANGGTSSLYFATAGDDQIDASDNLDVLTKYAEASRITTMVPSEDKWGIFENHFVYCQQMCKTDTKIGYDSEIQIPKPRLISPEAKLGRGDEDTNPIFGKVREFSNTWRWVPPEYNDLKYAMLWRLLRNMHHLMERRPEAFVPPQWGGLGLPVDNPKVYTEKLPIWHRHLISEREQGNMVAKSILANWGDKTVSSRGAEHSVPTIFLEEFPLLFDFKTIEELELILNFSEAERKLNYPSRKKLAWKQQWITEGEALQKIMQSQTYSNMWELETRITRGYKNLTWAQRASRMFRDYCQEIQGPLPSEEEIGRFITDKPGWVSERFIFAGTKVPYMGRLNPTDPSEDHIGPEDLHEVLVIGSHASPRVFLHYRNEELIIGQAE